MEKSPLADGCSVQAFPSRVNLFTRDIDPFLDRPYAGSALSEFIVEQMPCTSSVRSAAVKSAPAHDMIIVAHSVSLLIMSSSAAGRIMVAIGKNGNAHARVMGEERARFESEEERIRREHAGVRIDDLVVVAASPLPADASSWPVRVVDRGGLSSPGPFVVCGRTSDVEQWLHSEPCQPIYVVTDSLDTRLSGYTNVTAVGLAKGEWEQAVASICSRHMEAIPTMILSHACSTPQAVAVTDERGECTYAQLTSMAWSLGAILEAKGLQAGAHLGVLLSSTRLLPVALLGLGLRRMVPCNLSRCEDQRMLQLERLLSLPSSCAAVLVDSDLSNPAAGSGLQVIRIDELVLDPGTAPLDVWGKHTALAPSIQTLNDVCFIDWTSGSTGKPKGMATTMWKMSHWVRWRAFHFPMNQYGRRVAMGLFLPWYWHLPLAQGGTLVLIPSELNLDVSKLMAYLETKHVDWIDCLTPGQLQLTTEFCDAIPVRHIMCSGEALPVAAARAFLRKFPSVSLSNILSTTETSADICLVKRVTLALCDALAEDVSHVPVLSREAPCVVWGNSVELNSDGRLVHTGYNVEAGYLPGDDSSSFCSTAHGQSCTSGDCGYWVDANGQQLLCLSGRSDSVVKVRGHRVDLSGLEAVLASCPQVVDCCAFECDGTLWACVVTSEYEAVSLHANKAWPVATRPALVLVDSIHYTHTGKRDRKRMQALLPSYLKRGEGASAEQSGSTKPGSVEAILVAMQAQLMQPITKDCNFFACGGNSFKALRICTALGISATTFFAHPTASELALAVSRVDGGQDALPELSLPTPSSAPIRVCGMAMRLPGASSAAELWEKLKAGSDMLQTLPRTSGSHRAVLRKGVVVDEGVDLQLFSIPFAAAQKMSTEQRVLLGLAYEALEDAGYDPLHLPARAGVFVCGGSLPHLHADLNEMRSKRPSEYWETEVAHDKDYLASTIAYHLGTSGPAEVIQTACSSSLVAVTRAVQALRLGLCEIAICGGASFSPNEPIAAMDGMVWSADGVCRPFSRSGTGTVPADGAGLVVITTLDKVERAYATVEGVAVNNDGNRKASFSQPSEVGQVEVLRLALHDAKCQASQIDFVEAHGTGTRIGDPIEVQALARVHEGRPNKLPIGSIKGNLGHLNTVAGIASFIKTTLVVYHQSAPPSINAEPLNDLIPWERLPICVSTAGVTGVRRAGVSSFGIGGTNAHVILASGKPSMDPETVMMPLKQRPTKQQRTMIPPSPLTSSLPIGLADSASKDCVPPTAEGMMYDTIWVPRAVAPAHVSELPVIQLDGPIAFVHSLGIEAPHHFVTRRNVLQSALRFRALAVVAGGSDSLEAVDVLTWRCLELLVVLGKQTVGELQLFFFLGSSPRYAAVRGLLRSCRKEHPELRLRVLTVVAGPVVLPACPIEAMLEDGDVKVRRLVRFCSPPTSDRVVSVGTALVTGSLRGLGLQVARWLMDEARARKVLLVGRKKPKESALLDQLVERGATVLICDVCDWEQVRELPDVDLVIHCAGTVDDQLLRDTTEERTAAVLAPKLRGTINLKQRFHTSRLVAFSSSSCVFGVLGQGTYAAANAFMDEVCRGDSIQWGGWAGVGMAADLNIQPLAGERFLSVSRGLELLGTILDATRENPTLVVDVDWPTYSGNATVCAQVDGLLAEVMDTLATPQSMSTTGTHARVGWSHAYTLQLGEGCRSWQQLQQHVVDGRPVFPASGYMCWALQAVLEHGRDPVLSDVRFVRLLDLSKPRECVLTLTSNALVEDDIAVTGTIQITCEGVVHSLMSFRCIAHGRALRHEPVDAPARRQVAEPWYTVCTPYTHFREQGFEYGPDFSQLRNVRVQSNGHLAEASLCGPRDTSVYPLCAGTLDSALQLASFADTAAAFGMPTRVEQISWLRPHEKPGLVTADCTSGGGVNVAIMGSDGSAIALVKGVKMLSFLRATPVSVMSAAALQPSPPPLELCSTEEKVLDVNMRDGTTLLEHLSRIRAVAKDGPAVVRVEDSEEASAVASGAIDMGLTVINSHGCIVDEHLVPPAPPSMNMIADSSPYVAVIDTELGKVMFEGYQPLADLAAWQVDVRAQVWALNFRDVLVAKGAIPEEVAGQTLGLGGECYGQVQRVGAGVTSVSIGDFVVCVPPDGLGSRLVTHERWVTRAPVGMSPESAVSGTMAYATAWLALIRQARIRSSDAVLIHSAAGGVGLAAVHLCLREGCTVYATASTQAKHEILLQLGVSAVFNSRDTSAYTRGIMHATGSAGVDVILNSLSGDNIRASLGLLRPFGRFVEIGKRDAYEESTISLAPFLRGLTYCAAHLDVFMLEHPLAARVLLEEVWAAIPSLPSLPHVSFPMHELNTALDYMARGTHVGKILISVSSVGANRSLPPVYGPLDDAMVRSLRALRSAKKAHSAPPSGRCLVLRGPCASLDEDLRDATIVFTQSRAVAQQAISLNVKQVIELRTSWGLLKSAQLRELLNYDGHVVVMEDRNNRTGMDASWLREHVTELVGFTLNDDDSFESHGVDSLMLITLAQRISERCGKRFSVDDIQAADTIRGIILLISGKNVPPALQISGLQRPRVLCLHGFRSNADMLSVQLRPYITNHGEFEFVFANAPRSSTGEPEVGIPPQVETFEWWGTGNVPYKDAWKTGFDGFDEALAALNASGPYDGVIGFSQGGGVASLVSSRWYIGFSPVEPPTTPSSPLGQDIRPSLLFYDPNEEYVSQAQSVKSRFKHAEVQTHTFGHVVPLEKEAIARFGSFLAARLTERCDQEDQRVRLRSSGKEISTALKQTSLEQPALAPISMPLAPPVAHHLADGKTNASESPAVEIIEYSDLVAMGPDPIEQLRRAFVGKRAYGIVGVRGVPSFAQARQEAFEAAVHLAVHDAEGREKTQAVRQTYPGWNGRPGRETHPLQSCWIHNIKEEVGTKQIDPFYGKNVWPNDDYKRKFTAMNECMYSAALLVLRGCDRFLERDHGSLAPGRKTLEEIGVQGTTLAGRWIWYDSKFSRDDNLLELKPTETTEESLSGSASPGLTSTPVASPAECAPADRDEHSRGRGGEGDGLASMRTAATAMRTSGENDACTRKSGGGQGDGLASMRTAATAMRSSGENEACSRKGGGGQGDGLASMRTAATAMRSSGENEACSRKGGGGQGDGLASMRTAATAMRSSGENEACSRKGGGGQGDGLASMRTAATAMRSSGENEACSRKGGGGQGDGLASMRTAATAMRSSGENEACSRKGGGGQGDGLASMRTAATAMRSSGADNSQVGEKCESSESSSTNLAPDLGAYWLPWHIDSQFVTLLTSDDFYEESSGKHVSPPAEREKVGLVAMNEAGEVAAIAPHLTPDTMLLQMGGFAQIYTGGVLNACRHAVLRQSAQPGVARATYCNFWYAPWDLVCVPAGGTGKSSINHGWNALMDDSYMNISMQRSFSHFREFFTSIAVADERKVDDAGFASLAEILPLRSPHRLLLAPEQQPLVYVDVATDIRCPASYIAVARLRLAIMRLGASERVRLRYHPVFLDPSIKEEGEELEGYLMREHGVTIEEAQSENFPINKAAAELGFKFHAKRRVINTSRAFQAVALAAEEGLDDALFGELAREYFEQAADISCLPVLRAAIRRIGLRLGDLRDHELDFRIESAAEGVHDIYEKLAQKPKGIRIAGIDGVPVQLPFADPRHPVSLLHRGRRGYFEPTWPYTAADFSRLDESSDALMYSTPRFVAHLDDSALDLLTKTYRCLLAGFPHRHKMWDSSTPVSVLDTCSSWLSHLPNDQLPPGSRVAVQGLNRAELEANTQATERVVVDLNERPELPFADGTFDLVTNVSSVDYLTQPALVFGEMHRVLRPGGCIAVSFSNRCFESKAVALWLRKIADGAALAEVVCNYIHFGALDGWSHISCANISPVDSTSGECLGDPLYIVIATKK
ncbi:hypothetical protein AB1Y20_023299 [Prymnesium parvum]|uniref:Uncharacterized protein n=1 Tax=Prymnesium parvum TaxID=97485 RepID=A0AB34JF18_PRYPA